MLAEFKYGFEPFESFSGVFGDQGTPRRSGQFHLNVTIAMTDMSLDSIITSRKIFSPLLTGSISSRVTGMVQRGLSDLLSNEPCANNNNIARAY
jgi:hypothetical protein